MWSYISDIDRQTDILTIQTLPPRSNVLLGLPLIICPTEDRRSSLWVKVDQLAGTAAP